MMKQHWMPIAIVVGFALVLFLAVRYDLLYKQEIAKPQKMTPEELEVLRKKERDKRYRKAFVPQQLQEISAKAEAKRLANWKANFPWLLMCHASLIKLAGYSMQLLSCPAALPSTLAYNVTC